MELDYVANAARLGISKQAATELAGRSTISRKTLLQSCCNGSAKSLLTISTDKDKLALTKAIGDFVKDVDIWLVDVSKLIIAGQEAANIRLPPFTLCSFASFGRQEMSPFSDLDVVVLCDAKDVQIVGDHFADNLARASTALRGIDPKSFAISFELASRVYSVQDFVANVSLLASYKVVEVFSIYEHNSNSSNPLPFVKQFEDERPQMVSACQSWLKVKGLDGIFSADSYSIYKTPNAKRHDIKRILSFFQRGMAIYNTFRFSYKRLEDDLPNATIARFLKSAKSQSTYAAWHSVYVQILAIRYYMHFSNGREEDMLDVNSNSDVVKAFNKVKPALDSVLVEIDALFKAM